MSGKEKAVLVIGLQNEGNEVEMVHALGYRTILFKREITLQDAMSADFPVEIDLQDQEAVIAKARELTQKYEILGIFTLNEYQVPLAARMREALGIPHGLREQAAMNCRNKKLTRRRLAEEGVGSAEYRLVRTPAQALAALQDFQLPAVVKPSNDSGSQLVACCETAEEVWAAVDAIRRNSNNWVGQAMDPEILLEEYLAGPEFSVESISVQGESEVLAITAKRTIGATEVGHTVPAPLAEEERAAIRQLVVDALTALGVTDCVTHTEVKLTPHGPRIIEVNARPGGDYIPLLVKATTGYDLREVALHLSIGSPLEQVPRHPVAAPSAAVRFFTAEADGVAQYGDAEVVQEMPGVQTLKLSVLPGGAARRTTSNYDRMGYVIVHGSADRDADQAAADVLDQLAFSVLSNEEEVTN